MGTIGETQAIEVKYLQRVEGLESEENQRRWFGDLIRQEQDGMKNMGDQDQK